MYVLFFVVSWVCLSITAPLSCSFSTKQTTTSAAPRRACIQRWWQVCRSPQWPGWRHLPFAASRASHTMKTQPMETTNWKQKTDWDRDIKFCTGKWPFPLLLHLYLFKLFQFKFLKCLAAERWRLVLLCFVSTSGNSVFLEEIFLRILM